MGGVLIEPDEAALVSRLLRDIAQSRGAPSALRSAAIAWLPRISSHLESDELREVVSLLRKMGAHRRIPAGCRDEARYASTYLAHRVDWAVASKHDGASSVPG
jgi:hypothetical protein